MTNVFDRSCIWCGESFELEAYDNDAEDFSKSMKEHSEYCRKKPEDKKLRKKILKLCEGKDLDESRKIVDDILNKKTRYCNGCNFILMDDENFKDAEGNEYCKGCKDKVEGIGEL